MTERKAWEMVRQATSKLARLSDKLSMAERNDSTTLWLEAVRRLSILKVEDPMNLVLEIKPYAFCEN